MVVKSQLAELIEDELGIDVGKDDIERPENYGDFAYPCMKAASELGKNPREVAEELAETIESDLINQMEVAGAGFLNFYLDRGKFAEKTVEILDAERAGLENKETSVLLEFSCPNLAKPMHIGHVRNNCIGDSLQKILRFAGYNVTSENYIGDWGTKHGQVIYAFKKWGSMEEFEEDPMGHMYELYVKLHQEAGEEEKAQAREWSKKIEEGDKEARELWEMFREATIRYNKKDYELMGIKFDRYTGESFVAEEASEIIEEGLNKEIFKQDKDGSVYVEFENDKYPSTIVKRSDGSTLYLSRDIANIKKRQQEGFDQNLYVVASEQDLHFQQLFKIAEQFGVTNMENEHVSYGMLRLQEGSMSSSKGNIITLRELMNKAIERAGEVESRDVSNSKEVGLGAVKYANLKVSRNKDINFDWDQVLSFEGDSGPYLQYSNVRAKSILEKAEEQGELMGQIEDEEYELLKKLSLFPEKVEASAEQREPAKIANYLSELCEEFNSFYHNCPVMDADKETKKRRLGLVNTFVKVSDKGLELLGIESLDEM